MVANHFLDDVEMGPFLREQTVHMCKQFHQDVRSLSERLVLYHNNIALCR